MRRREADLQAHDSNSARQQRATIRLCLFSIDFQRRRCCRHWAPPTLRRVGQRHLGTHSNYDVSPDARTFAMVRQNPATRIMVIQNLPALVRQLERGATRR
ncbi:MAG: hypothetical protein ABR543_18840 [Gemmatimonadaceae bacterium]